MKAIILSALIFLIILASLGLFFMYWFLSKQPENVVNNYLKSSYEVLVSYDEYGNIIFEPNEPYNLAILFYPENLIVAESYAPLCHRLAEEGYKVVLIKPLFNIALFSNFKAFKKLENETEINNWVVIGHGSGGGFGSYLIKKFPQKILGVVFLASYPYFDISEYNVSSLVIYGNCNAPRKIGQKLRNFCKT
ncbi:MAG: hypothetical protein PWP54_1379 [Thermosipho sp. (in: thermotogales)]|nr:hypothetical protein [Thermosipho sp. (in: thermotogales)]